MIFNTLSGRSGWIPVTPIGGSQLYIYCTLWEWHVLWKLHSVSRQLPKNGTSYSTLGCCTLCSWDTFSRHSLGVTGTGSELLERALNIICISLKFIGLESYSRNMRSHFEGGGISRWGKILRKYSKKGQKLWDCCFYSGSNMYNHFTCMFLVSIDRKFDYVS